MRSRRRGRTAAGDGKPSLFEGQNVFQHLAVTDVRPKAECPAAARATEPGGQRRPRDSTWSTTSEMTSSTGNSSPSPTSPKRLVEVPRGQSARARRAAAERRAVHRPLDDVLSSTTRAGPPAGRMPAGGPDGTAIGQPSLLRGRYLHLHPEDAGAVAQNQRD